MSGAPLDAPCPSRGSPLRGRRAAANGGFGLIEVIVSALIVALAAAAGATAFIASTRASGDLRQRADAQALAQQDENRLRGLNINQLSNLNQTLPAVTLDGTAFTVRESASYVSDSSGTPSCNSPSADYLQTTSTVTWSNMGTQSPVTDTSVLTPTVGSLDPTHGTLAVSVVNAGGTGMAGMNVNISGPSAASGTTAANGCVLFGNLPTGTYSVSVAPSVGTYVDAHTGQAVTATSPDTASPSPSVTAGTTASSPTQFQLDAAGSLDYSFVDAFPSGVSPSPAPPATAPAVVLVNPTMNTPSYRLCSAQDSSCPAVGSPDTSFTAGAWSGTGGQVVATPLFPFAYSTYAGVCTSDDPSLLGGTDGSASVTAGGTGAVNLTLPAMVVRLYSGTDTTSPETTLPTGGDLIVTDTGCNMRYVGYTTAPPPVSAGQAVLPLTTTLGSGANDTGLLKFPGMPYGQYTVCYDDAGQMYGPVSVTNQGAGEIVNLFAGATTAGTC